MHSFPLTARKTVPNKPKKPRNFPEKKVIFSYNFATKKIPIDNSALFFLLPFVFFSATLRYGLHHPPVIPSPPVVRAGAAWRVFPGRHHSVIPLHIRRKTERTGTAGQRAPANCRPGRQNSAGYLPLFTGNRRTCSRCAGSGKQKSLPVSPRCQGAVA